MARCLRPGGVLLFGDLGKEQRIHEDKPVGCCCLKWLKDVGDNFAEGSCYGEGMKDIVLAEGSLELGSQKDHWINSNWIDPNDPAGPEIYDIMQTWHPVSFTWSI